MKFERDDDWFSDGNLDIIADFLALCEDSPTLQVFREIYPAEVLRAAARRLDPEVFGRIKAMTIELNRRAA